MKKIALLLSAVFLAATLALAQQEALGGFIEKYKNDPAFTYAYLGKDVLEVVTKTSVEEKDWKKVHNVVRNIGSLSILAADSLPNAKALYREALALVPTAELDDLLMVRDGSDDVRIWVKEEDAVVSDLILLVGSPDEFVLICFAGNLELGNLAELAQAFDAEAAQDLARSAAAVAPDFRISPNPSSGAITLTYADETDRPKRLGVADQSGRSLMTLDLTGEPTQQITLRGLPPGVYWLQLETEKGKIGAKQVQIVLP